MPTLVDVYGFEDGISTLSTNGGGLWDSITGTPTVQSSVKRTGGYALEVSPSAGEERCGRDFSAANIAVAAFYVYFNALPSADSELAFFVCTGDTNRGALWFDNASGKFGAQFDGGGTRQTGGDVISTGTWYRIDMRCTYNTNPRTLDWQVNGTAMTQATKAQAGSTNSGWRFGTGTTPQTYQCYYDDAVISVTTGDYPIGALAVDRLSPDSDGTHVAGTNIMENQAGEDIGVVTAYNLINSNPPSATAYIQQLANGTGNYAEVNFADISSSRSGIHGAMAYLAYTSATTTTNKGAIEISKDSWSTNTVLWGDIGGTTSDYSDGSTSNLFFKSVIVSGVTDDTTVNALKARMGGSDDAAPDPYWIDVWVEVAYIPAAASKSPPVFQKRTHVLRRR
jgi:hypothetical protein